MGNKLIVQQICQQLHIRNPQAVLRLALVQRVVSEKVPFAVVQDHTLIVIHHVRIPHRIIAGDALLRSDLVLGKDRGETFPCATYYDVISVRVEVVPNVFREDTLFMAPFVLPLATARVPRLVRAFDPSVEHLFRKWQVLDDYHTGI